MPLIKSVAPKVVDSLEKAATEAQVTKPVESPNESPKAVYTGRKDAPMTKDDYWKRKEEHDLRKDPQIRLSGILQALLSSVNFGQYCTGTTAEDYLTKVEEAALRLAKFVKEKAE